MCGNGLRSLVQKLLCTKECYVMSDGVLTRMGMIEIWQWYGIMEYQNPQHSPSMRMSSDHIENLMKHLELDAAK